MNIRRWLAVLLIGSTAGLVWAAPLILNDATRRTAWLDEFLAAGSTWFVSAVLVQLAVHAVCGLRFGWWRWYVALAYLILFYLWGVAGLADYLRNFGDIGKGELIPMSRAYLLWWPLWAFLYGAWGLGRLARVVSVPEADS